MTQWTYSIFRTGGFSNAPIGDDRFATDIGDVVGVSFSARATHLLQYDDQADDRYLWHVGGGYNFGLLGANDAIGSGTFGKYREPAAVLSSSYDARVRCTRYPEFPSTFGPAARRTALLRSSTRADTWPTTSTVRLGKRSGNMPMGGASRVYGDGRRERRRPDTLSRRLRATRLPPDGRTHGVRQKASRAHEDQSVTEFFSLKNGICGWGAWEVAARYSYVDLRNPASAQRQLLRLRDQHVHRHEQRGERDAARRDAGLTWFWNVHAKVQFNWIHAMLDNTTTGNSTADLFVSRVQVDF